MSRLTYQIVLSLVLDHFAKKDRGQYAEIVEAVGSAAAAKGLATRNAGGYGVASSDRHRIEELVREAMWDCLIKRVIVFGMDSSNAEWPWYRLTEQGANAVKAGSPQPYDPDGFLKYFRDGAPGIDPVVVEYITEAVHAFNSGCLRAAAVMLGGASEKLILVLIDTLEAGIQDAAKQTQFGKDIARHWAINYRFTVLQDRLERMAQAKRLTNELNETVRNILPAGFELLRRCRNAAGHPDAPGQVDESTIFFNLRTFTEYARRVLALTDHIANAGADW
jgi:hypothetical protein